MPRETLTTSHLMAKCMISWECAPTTWCTCSGKNSTSPRPMKDAAQTDLYQVTEREKERERERERETGGAKEGGGEGEFLTVGVEIGGQFEQCHHVHISYCIVCML